MRLVVIAGPPVTHKVVSRLAVKTVQHADGKVFAWTVDMPQRLRKLQELGADA
jgi:glycerophosphoryl diester phosphodiesterase